MTREEAIWWVNHLFEIRKEEYWNKGAVEDAKEVETAQNMAIEALQREDNLLKSLETNEPIYDMVDVVRCKDCKYYDESLEVCRCSQWDLSRIEYPMVDADGFCSYGERGDQ